MLLAQPNLFNYIKSICLFYGLILKNEIYKAMQIQNNPCSLSVSPILELLRGGGDWFVCFASPEIKPVSIAF